MSDVKYRPLFGRVLIKREIEEKRGSILLPNAKKHARSEGNVIAVGPTADQSIKIGDHVIFGRHAGTWLDSTYTGAAENEDGTLFLCQDEDILATISKDEQK